MTTTPQARSSLNQTGAVLLRYLGLSIGWRLLSFVLLILAWAILAAASRGAFPTPAEGVAEFLRLTSPEHLGNGITDDAPLWNHVTATASRAYGGLALAVAIFLPLGILLGWVRSVYQASVGLLEFARSVPAFMLVLVLLSASISGEKARMICIVGASGVVVCDYVATGVLNANRDRADVLRLMGISKYASFWHANWVPILIDALLPALRIVIGISLIVALVVETLLVPKLGLGVLLNGAMGRVGIAGGLVLVFVAGMLGWIGNLIVTLLSDLACWFFEGRPLPFLRSR